MAFTRACNPCPEIPDAQGCCRSGPGRDKALPIPVKPVAARSAPTEIQRPGRRGARGRRWRSRVPAIRARRSPMHKAIVGADPAATRRYRYRWSPSRPGPLLRRSRDPDDAARVDADGVHACLQSMPGDPDAQGCCRSGPGRDKALPVPVKPRRGQVRSYGDPETRTARPAWTPMAFNDACDPCPGIVQLAVWRVARLGWRIARSTLAALCRTLNWLTTRAHQTRLLCHTRFHCDGFRCGANPGRLGAWIHGDFACV
ncbi:hypothetical protein FHT03_000314 [Xanthomonas arboricola]